MKIILLGPQGSGKGTQAKLLKKEIKLPHISVGALFRKISKKKTSILGKKLRNYMNKGLLVPNKITTKILKQRLEKKDCKKGFILDGCPRSLIQAKELDKITNIDKVFYIHITDTLAVKRLSNRWQCQKCGAIYGIDVKPKKKGVCDKCKVKLYQRQDDKPKAIKERLREFHQMIKPILKHYKKITIKMDGSLPVNKLLSQIKKEVKKIK